MKKILLGLVLPFALAVGAVGGFFDSKEAY